MSIDMSQFHQVFFEECFEGLEAMESGLLTLDMGDIDSEIINTIFRGAHSIKGGSGTFGFTVVADYTHIMETLLDEMRDGRRQVTQPAVDVLLGSVDCLREMLTAIQNEQIVDDVSVAKHKTALEVVLTGGSMTEEPSTLVELESANEETVVNMAADILEEVCVEIAEQGWKIAFCPYLDLLKTGNDPVRLFRELNELGELTTIANIQDIPGFYELDPEECNISWDLKVAGDIAEDEIREIFNWVEGDCEMEIQPLAKAVKPVPVVKKVDPEPAPVVISNNPVPKSVEAKPKVVAEAKKSEAQDSDNEAVKTTAKASSIRVDTDKID
ncbi:MAG: Hpt domain-containing protein, partial [Flavobacteriaceae bacterium]|nr:Hpt domain-containing protein [Flavobacteriaceae bacterium]